MPNATIRESRLGWSFSRHRTYSECLRRLYWQYYGSRDGWSVDAPAEAQAAYELKQLTKLPLLVGNIFHEVMGRWLRTHSPGQPFPTERLMREVDAAVDLASKEAHFWHDVYSDGVGQDEITAIREHSRWLITRASDNGYVKRLCKVPRNRLLLVDNTKWEDRKAPYRDIDLFGMPDVLVFDVQGRAHFIDWKTGAENPDPHEIQMGAQALFAREKLGVNLESSQGHVVYLDSGEVYTIDDLSGAAEAADALVCTYIADMVERLTDFGSNFAADIERFPMTENASACDYCNFKGLCGR